MDQEEENLIKEDNWELFCLLITIITVGLFFGFFIYCWATGNLGS